MEGRPKKGMFIALPSNLKGNVEDVSPSNSRIQAILLETESKNIMIVNAYFLKDPKTIEYHINADLEDILAVIENLVDSNHCDDIIIAGDLNVHFDRRNGNVKRLKRFLTSNRLGSSWMRFNIDFSHELEANEITYTSTINHILWNEQFYKNVLKVGVLHLPDNTSGHSPIYCDVNITCKLATNIVEKNTMAS